MIRRAAAQHRQRHRRKWRQRRPRQVRAKVAATGFNHRRGYRAKQRALGLAHRVEVIGYGELTDQEAQPAGRLGGSQRHDLDQRFAGLRDYERLAPGSLVDKLRKVSLGFVNVNGAQNGPLD